MPQYVPSCVAHFTFKFDDDELELNAESTDEVFQASKLTRFGYARPLFLTATSESHILNRVPKTCTVELPGYRMAGSFNLSMDFKELPIDPRTVRAAAVDIHIGAVDIEKFHAGVTRQPQTGNQSTSILKTTDATRLLTATIDEWNVDHKSGSSEITMSGRDMRGILIDTPIAVNPMGQQILDVIDLSKPIHEVVKQVLQFHPLFGRFSVRVNPLEWGNDGVPRPGSPNVVPRHRKGAKGNKKTASPAPGADNLKLSFWDLIVQFCYLVGAVPLMVGTEIIIRPTRRLYDQQNAGLDYLTTTPFAGGVQRVTDRQSGTALPEPLSIRKIVYGRDTEDISFKRTFSGFQKPRVVRIVGQSAATARGPERTIVAWWPPLPDKKAKATKGSPGEDKTQEEILTIPVAGISDIERLTEIAKAYYEEIGRNEVGGSCVTKNLASFGGDNTDPDLVRLRPGDAVQMAVDTRSLNANSPLVSEYTDHMRMPFSARVTQVADILGGDEALARILVATARGQIRQLQNFFRVSTARYDWGQQGLKIAFDFQNYIEPRFKADRDKKAATATTRV